MMRYIIVPNTALIQERPNSSKYGHAFDLVCIKSLESTRQENPSNDSG